MPSPGSPTVSVITPAYNAERFIAQTLDSVLAQTHGDWELVVADDSSTDGTASIAEDYARRDGRIRLLRMPGNQGQGPARNAALGVAHGDFVAFLDADDLWDPEKLAR